VHLIFDFPETHIECDVDFSRRRTLAIIVNHNGEVKIAAPKGTSRTVIVDWVNSKSGWIIKKLNQFRDAQLEMFPQEYAHGELIMFLGKKYPLHLEIDLARSQPAAIFSQGALLVRTPVADTGSIRQVVEAWCRNAAEEIVRQKVEHFQEIINVRPNRVTIRRQKTRWGSCSTKGNLNFNWKVIMAPVEVIDYLVIHELCHLIHHNHSPEFWNLVAGYLPDYKVRRAWLKQNAAILSL